MNPNNLDPLNFQASTPPDPNSGAEPTPSQSNSQPDAISPLEPSNPEPSLQPYNNQSYGNVNTDLNSNSSQNIETDQYLSKNANVPEQFQSTNISQYTESQANEYYPTQPTEYSAETLQNSQPSELPPVINTPILPTINTNQYQNTSPVPGRANELMGMPPETPTYPLSTMNSRKSFPKKVVIFIGIFLIIVVLIISFLILKGKDDTKKINSKPPKPTATSSKAIVATSLTDLSKACNSSPITNAKAYNGQAPHKISIFKESVLANNAYTRSYTNYPDKNWEVNNENFESAELIGCLSRKTVTESGNKCDFLDDNKNKITIKQYDVVYLLNLYEAKTNKKLATIDINGPAGDCPFVASFDKSDPKIFGEPDEGSIINAVKKYVIE